MKNLPETSRQTDIFGIKISDISIRSAVGEIFSLSKGNRGRHVVTINSEFVMLAQKDPKFMKILEEADLAVADGAWVAKLKLILGGKCPDRITGVDLVEQVCRQGAKKGIRVGFLGGFGSVAEVVSKRQKEKNKGLIVSFFEAGDPTIGSDDRTIEAIDRCGGIDVLFVAFGMGKQEYWIARMREKANVGVFIGVGGAFDYISGKKRRAPRFMQQIGVEWLWRLVMEPSRIWRMRVLPAFFVMSLVFVFLRKWSIFQKS